MHLFDKLVTQALQNQPHLSALRTVVEKELLHHDILRILSQNHCLTHLTFIGGTCLRTCYGAVRLSEDLDFTGGQAFSCEHLSDLSNLLMNTLNEKYGLTVKVSQPIKTQSNVSTWKIKIDTQPQQKHLPAQRIHIDICQVPSYEKQPMLLLNPYNIDMGTSGLIVQAQSREEIYTDKLLAFALRPNRLQARDLWDILWLHQHGFKPRFELIRLKLRDRHLMFNHFFDCFDQRQRSLTNDPRLEPAFKQEMHRFLPQEKIHEVSNWHHLWDFIKQLIDDLGHQLSLQSKS